MPRNRSFHRIQCGLLCGLILRIRNNSSSSRLNRSPHTKNNKLSFFMSQNLRYQRNISLNASGFMIKVPNIRFQVAACHRVNVRSTHTLTSNLLTLWWNNFWAPTGQLLQPLRYIKPSFRSHCQIFLVKLHQVHTYYGNSSTSPFNIFFLVLTNWH